VSPVVFAADEQDDHPVDADRWMKLANDVLTTEKVGDDVEVSVMFVDERAIAELNEKFMGKSGPTDVLSFPIDEGPPDSGRVPDAGGNGPGYELPDDSDGVLSLLGDVVICPAVVMRKAPEHTGNYEDELALLLVHGLLHLLGMDHMVDEEAEAMEAKERDLLARHWRELPAQTWASGHGEHDDRSSDSR
jgi:probable rRNA maturation factor